MKTVKIIIYCLFICNGIHSQKYLWPTNSSFLLTSTFCEFRPDHYHSGIDIKTWNREGYPCYAIEDGYIESIKVSPFGYGKVIYLRLKDGNLALYAHLQCFTNEVDQKIRKKQIKRRKYRIKWMPKRFKVKKGEIVGYTGSSGIGTPHLHFEIRKPNDMVLNPLVYYRNRIHDEVKPVLEKLAVIPLENNSTINDSYLPKIFKLINITDNIYIIKEPLFVKGKVGLAINSYDQAEGLFNKYCFYQMMMYIQGEEVFHVVYNELDFAESRYINTAIFYPFWSDYRELFYKLYLESYNSSGFYQHYSHGDGSFQITDRPVSFSIIVSDYHGNQSIVKGELIPDTKKTIKLCQVAQTDSMIDLTFMADPLDKLDFMASNDGITWNKLDKVELKRLANHSKHTIYAKVFMTDSSFRYLQIAAESDFKKIIHKNIDLQPDSIPVSDLINLKTELHFLDERLVFSVNNIYNNSRLKIMPFDTTINMEYISDGNYQVQIPEEVIRHDTLGLKLLVSNRIIWQDSYRLKKYLAGEYCSSSWYDSSIQINSYEKTFFNNTYITAQLEQSESIKQKAPVAGDIYHLLPEHIGLFKEIQINVKVDSLISGMNWDLYRINEKNKFTFIHSSFDSTHLIFNAHIKSLGKYVVAADTLLPEIIVERPLSGEVYYTDPEVKFFIQDSISGIGDEDDISINLDGRFVLPEWDPEKMVVEAQFEGPLDTGRHTLEISVRDRAGNINNKKIYFTVKY